MWAVRRKKAVLKGRMYRIRVQQLSSVRNGDDFVINAMNDEQRRRRAQLRETTFRVPVITNDPGSEIRIVGDYFMNRQKR